jgi:hypothetical protein
LMVSCVDEVEEAVLADSAALNSPKRASSATD